MPNATFRKIALRQHAMAYLYAAVILVSLCCGVFNVRHEFFNELWQDEAYTIVNFAGNSLNHVFLNYQLPNNHIWFSAALNLWRKILPDNADVIALRTLPFIFFLAAIPAVFFCGRKFAGSLAGASAALLFASSSVTGAFALQLRGYGPSWLVVTLAFFSALQLIGGGLRRYFMLYAICCIAAVGLLPTNLFVLEILAIAVISGEVIRGRSVSRIEAVVLLVGPVLGLVSYLAVWSDLAKASQHSWSPWSLSDLISHWAFATTQQFQWLVPIFLICLASVVRLLFVDDPGRRNATQKMLIVMIVAMAGLGLWLYAMPAKPFPRTLVPILPIWYIFIGSILAQGVFWFQVRFQRVGVALTIGLLLIVSIRALSGEPCGQPVPHSPGEATLCYQYYRDAYKPSQAAIVVNKLRAESKRPVVLGYEAMWALYVANPPVAGAMLFNGDYAKLRPYLEEVDFPILVTEGRKQFEYIVEFLKLPINRYRLIADTGYFSVYSIP